MDSEEKDPMDQTILDCLEEFKQRYLKNPNDFHGIVIVVKMEDETPIKLSDYLYHMGGGLTYIEAIGMLNLASHNMSANYINKIQDSNAEDGE